MDSSQITWCQISNPTLKNYVIMSYILNLSVTQFSHVYNGYSNNNIYLLGSI